MVLSALRPDASLPEFLVHRAKSASGRRLAIDVFIGIVGCAAALWWRPTGWLVFASASLCFLSYGAWGTLDRARSRAATTGGASLRRILDVACAICGAVGVLAAAGILLGVWAIALGTWIS